MQKIETRTVNMIIGKAGGTAGKGAYNNKVSIPNAWATALGVSPDDRTLLMSFDGDKIIITKAD